MIYIIQTGNFVKIGYSRSVLRRLKELQAANPSPLKLVGSIPGTLALEHKIHKKLAPYRCGGGSEWYRLEPKVADFVQNLQGYGLLRLLES